MAKTRTGYLLLLPSMILMVFLVAYPVLKTVFDSLFFLRTQLGVSRFVGLENYASLMRDRSFWNTFLWTIEFTVITVGTQLVIGLALALLMKRQFRGQHLVRVSILIPWVIPGIISGVAWRQLFHFNGIINTVLVQTGMIGSPISWYGSAATAKATIIMANIWETTPFMALLLLAGLLAIPRDYYEAALVAGANAFQRFRHVTVPLLKPAIVVAVLFRLIHAMRIYDLVVVMTGGGPADLTTPLAMYAVNTYFTFGNIGYGAALSVTLLGVSVFVSLFFARGLQTKVT